MTCIVALRTPSGIIMGGDSCAGFGTESAVIKAPKIAKVGEFLVGYTSSFRMGQILHHVLSAKVPHAADDVYLFAITSLIPDIIDAFKANGFGQTKDGEFVGGQFILAHGTRLFVVQSDFSVLEYAEDYCAVGCGCDLARGAMFATKSSKMPDKRRVQIALEAAEEFSGMVRRPFHFLRTGAAK